MTKAVILARVSTLKQEKEGLSLKDIQLPELRDYAIKRDFEVVREFVFSESADYKIRKKFNEMIDFASKTGFDQQYLWGAEWWYWMKEQGYSEHWEIAKKLFM